MFNPDPTPATMNAGLRPGVSEAMRVDFLEQPLGELRARNGVASVAVAPHGIATILMK
jgi:hypothetical protein